MTRRADRIEQYVRAFLNGARHEVRALEREHPYWNPNDDFGIVAAVFEIAAFAHFGESLEPEALRAFLIEALDKAARARPPVRPLVVQQLIEDVYGEPHDEPEDRNPRNVRALAERQEAVWFALRLLVPVATPVDAIDRLIANAAEFLDECAEFDGRPADLPCTRPEYAYRSGLVHWRH